jgi:hypothetical protein
MAWSTPACHGALTVIHRDVMQGCTGRGLWHRVEHVAGIVAERGRLLETLQADERRQAEKGDDQMTDGNHIFSGLRVLDLASFIAGPAAT